ncbi:MAG: DUF6745 domain-containing protein [Luteibaculaceae bacterium]
MRTKIPVEPSVKSLVKFLEENPFSFDGAVDATLDFYKEFNLSPPKTILAVPNPASFTECASYLISKQKAVFNFVYTPKQTIDSLTALTNTSRILSYDALTEHIRLNVARKLIDNHRAHVKSIRSNLRNFASFDASLERILLETTWKTNPYHSPSWSCVGDFGVSYYGWAISWMQTDIEKPLPSFILEFVKSSVFLFAAFSNVALVCPAPKRIVLDQNSLPSCNIGPALSWENLNLYAFRGFPMPEDLYGEFPSAENFLTLKNVTQRMHAVDLLGSEKISRMLNLELLHEELDHAGNPAKLLGGKIPTKEGNKPLKMLEVICPSTARKFYITVPNSIQGALEGIAWSFGKTPKTYKPNYET